MRSLLCVLSAAFLFVIGAISACTYVPPTASDTAGAAGADHGSSSSGSAGKGGGGAGGEGGGIGGGGVGVGGAGGGGVGGEGGSGGATEIFLNWVNLPTGTFEMGSMASAVEQPLHFVTLPSFDLTLTEITVSEYMQCVSAGGCIAPTTVYPDCYWVQTGFEQYPVNCVNWESAASFCKWAGARLPSEAEWEYAARSLGQANVFPWGSETPTCDYAVILSCGLTIPEPVCSKPLGYTVEGLCDMAGNAYEWVQDSWHANYNGAPIDGTAWEGTVARVIRGGGFNSNNNQIRTSWRVQRSPTYNDVAIGFRCAR